MSKWRDLTLVPFEGLLLEIEGGVLRLELSTADCSEPLTLAVHGFWASWVDQFWVALPRLIEALASWIKDTTTLRLRLGYSPLGCHALSFKQFIIEQVSRLPLVTSLEVSGVDVDSLLHGLRLGDVSSLFKNIRMLSFSGIALYALCLHMDWLRATVQIVKDAAESSSDEANH
ncbi:hypothetical protein FRC04_002471 [Tulasnella sp. 424]|nr:hypothetical protein FRC04_002471 [Tulasnella sp. 424]